jgi:uncharacterized protein (TIGR03000 family)
MSQRSFSFLTAAAVVATLLAVAPAVAQVPGEVYPAGYYGYSPGYAASGFYTGTWGYRHSWGNYPYGFHDYGLNNYGSAPTTSRYSGYYPPEEWTPPGPGHAAEVYPAGYYGYSSGYAASDFYTGTWGYRHSWGNYPYGFHDYGLNNYGSAPTTSQYSGYYPPEEWTPSPTNAAEVEITVPPDATLWFDGVLTRQTGARRGFVSPPLTPGQNYTYEVHARWTQDGRTVDRTRTIRVRANTQTEADLTRP